MNFPNRRLDPTQWKHGTFTCYTHHRCRCELCKKAAADMNARWRRIRHLKGKCIDCPILVEEGHGLRCEVCQKHNKTRHLEPSERPVKIPNQVEQPKLSPLKVKSNGRMSPELLRDWVRSLGQTTQQRRALLHEMLRFSADDRMKAEDVADVHEALRLIEGLPDDPEPPIRSHEVDLSEGLWPWDMDL